MRTIIIAVLTVYAFGLTGCLPLDKPHGGTAVIDMTRIARVLGRDEAIAERLQEDLEEKKTQLTKLRDEMVSKLEVEKEKLGKKPKEEELQKLNTLVVDANKILRQQAAQAEQATQQIRNQQLLRFREEVEPVARRVAKSRNLDTVLIKHQYILVHDDAVDITDAVIHEMQLLEKGAADS
jgi:Skp family chaperone for outer membrane proteins